MMKQRRIILPEFSFGFKLISYLTKKVFSVYIDYTNIILNNYRTNTTESVSCTKQSKYDKMFTNLFKGKQENCKRRGTDTYRPVNSARTPS